MLESVFRLRSFVLVTCVLFLPQGYTEECDSLSSGVTLPDPEDCHGYFLCLAGDKLQHYCEHGYIYDEDIRTCVAGKCPPCSRLPAPLEECEDLSVGQTLQDPEDCHGYFLCHRGEKLPQYCENGLRFDVDVGACIVGKCPPCYNSTWTTTDEPPSSWTPDSSSLSTVQTTEVSSDSPSDTTEDSPESTTPSQESTTDLPTTETTEDSSDLPNYSTEDSPESTTPSQESTTDLPSTETTEDSSESTMPSQESTTDLPTTDSSSMSTELSSESTDSSPIDSTSSPIDLSSTTDSTPLPSSTTDSSASSTDPTSTSSSATDSTPSTSTTRAPSVSCDNYRDGSFFSDPIHCQKYYVCQNRKPIQLQCQKGTWFDDVHYVCNFRHLVKCPANID